MFELTGCKGKHTYKDKRNVQTYATKRNYYDNDDDEDGMVRARVYTCAHATIQDTDDKINKNIITKITQII